MEIKVLSGGKGSLVSFASLQRDLALSKHSGDRNRSAAIIGLHWRDRAKHKKARMRMEALLDIQAKPLTLNPQPPTHSRLPTPITSVSSCRSR